MRGRVYQAGFSRSVAIKDLSLQIPRADTPIRSRRVMAAMSGHGILAAVTVGALGLIADGATLLTVAWMMRR